jgi:hypothetical protein
VFSRRYWPEFAKSTPATEDTEITESDAGISDDFIKIDFDDSSMNSVISVNSVAL